jgi:hypothetical protein
VIFLWGADGLFGRKVGWGAPFLTGVENTDLDTLYHLLVHIDPSGCMDVMCIKCKCDILMTVFVVVKPDKL